MPQPERPEVTRVSTSFGIDSNPILIPRNHRVEQAIQSAYDGDFAPFHRLVDALAAPYADQVEYADLEAAPRPEEVVHETFCGT